MIYYNAVETFGRAMYIENNQNIKLFLIHEINGKKNLYEGRLEVWKGKITVLKKVLSDAHTN